jgi:hypothetical protein
MKRSRTDVDHHVSGQCGEGNQAVAPKLHHCTTRQNPKLPSGISVLPSCTQCRQVLSRCQEGGQESPSG